MDILVTGGAGYIGSHVVKQLLESSNYTITIIDNLSTGSLKTIQTLEGIKSDENSMKFIKADLSNFAQIEEIFKTNSFQAIIHFAASIIVPESVTNPLKYYLNNTTNTINLINLAIKYGVSKFIFSSTAAVYGNPEEIPVREDSPTCPINPYGMSKLMSENVLKDTAKAYKGFKYVILRYFNVAGADIKNRIGQCFPNATHLIKVAAETAVGKRDKLYIFGDDYPTFDGTCIRDYIHVDDLSDAHLMALEYLEDHDSDVFNCGYGYGYSVKQVIETMRKVSGVNFPVEVVGRREGDAACLVANSDKIKTLMGWQPKYNQLELICQTALNWEKKLLSSY